MEEEIQRTEETRRPGLGDTRAWERTITAKKSAKNREGLEVTPTTTRTRVEAGLEPSSNIKKKRKLKHQQLEDWGATKVGTRAPPPSHQPP